MKELEEMIIGSVYGEDRYNEVSFLEHTDFTNYPDKPYRQFFHIAKSMKCKSELLVRAIVKTKDTNLINLLACTTTIPVSSNLSKHALILLEIKFKSLFADLLSQLSIDSKNEVESKLLSEAFMEVPRQDIFTLSDNILDYLGTQASETTRYRIGKFIEYRDKRALDAKKVINGIK